VRIVVLVVALVVLSACGNQPSDQPAEQEAGPVKTSPSGVEVGGELDSKPTIEIPSGEPPTELEIFDIVEGDGAEAQATDEVTTHYVGKSWSTGKEFDASWAGGGPISFGLDRVIAGWGQGIPGMKVGGRRLLVIPPELGYGQAGAGADIGPGETLVFVIDLVDAK